MEMKKLISAAANAGARDQQSSGGGGGNPIPSPATMLGTSSLEAIFYFSISSPLVFAPCFCIFFYFYFFFIFLGLVFFVFRPYFYLVIV